MNSSSHTQQCLIKQADNPGQSRILLTQMSDMNSRLKNSSPISQRTCYTKSNDTHTTRILLLQQQLLNVRKQMSQKHSNWEKQRNNYLNQQEINNMQIIECKQSIVNLSQINQTLTDVLANGDFMADAVQKIKQMTFIILGTQYNENKKSKQDIQSKQKLDKNRQIMLEPEKIKMKNMQTQNKRLHVELKQQREKIQILSVKIQKLQAQSAKKQSILDNLKGQQAQFQAIIQQKQQKILQCYKQISAFNNQRQSGCNAIYTGRTNNFRQSNQPFVHAYASQQFMSTDRNNKQHLLPKQMKQPKQENEFKYPKNRNKLIKKQLTLQQLDADTHQRQNNSSYLIMKTGSEYDPISDNSSYLNEISVHDNYQPASHQKQRNNNSSNNINKQNDYCRDEHRAILRKSSSKISNKLPLNLVSTNMNNKRNNVSAVMDKSYLQNQNVRHYARQFEQAINVGSDYSEYHHDMSQDGSGSQNQTQYQRLLCEICNRVFGFQQFQMHMQKCGYQCKQQANIRDLLKKKKQISQKLSQLHEQQMQQKSQRRSTKQHKLTYKHSRIQNIQVRPNKKSVNVYNQSNNKSGSYAKNYYQ